MILTRVAVVGVAGWIASDDCKAGFWNNLIESESSPAEGLAGFAVTHDMVLFVIAQNDGPFA